MQPNARNEAPAFMIFGNFTGFQCPHFQQRGGGGADEGVLLERLEREPAELRHEPAALRGGALADGSPYRGAGGLGVRGAVVDVHGEDEEDDIGDDEERHEEREPPPERAERGRRAECDRGGRDSAAREGRWRVLPRGGDGAEEGGGEEIGRAHV